MPDPINDQWARVTDPSVPYREFNVPADAVGDLKVLKGKPTHELDGSPIPPKFTPDELTKKSEGSEKK